MIFKKAVIIILLSRIQMMSVLEVSQAPQMP